MSARPYHHGNLREALLERAEAEIEARGVEGLSLRALARDLDVSHAAPARHFRDRQALLDALAERGFACLNAELTRAAGGPGTHRDRFRALGRAYVTFALAHPTLLAVMFEIKHDPDARELRAAGEAGMVLTHRLLAEAQKAGALGPGDPADLAYAAFTAVHGAATLAAGGFTPDRPVVELADTLADLLWTGMGGRTG